MNRNDKRYIHTAERLREAMLQLLENNMIDGISVTDICCLAGCSRNAFYQHFETKYQLYDLVLKEITEAIRSSVRPVVSDLREVDEEIIMIYSHRLLEVISGKRKQITALLRGSSAFSGILRDSMFETMKEEDLRLTGKDALSPETELMTKFAVGGISSFIEYWLLSASLSQQEAQAILDVCLRDILRHVSDSLI